MKSNKEKIKVIETVINQVSEESLEKIYMMCLALNSIEIKKKK